MSDDTPLNGDLEARVIVDTRALEWTSSPSGLVDRRRVHRVGPAESGQVTSVVRYAPGASFPEHDHPDGEEIFVLEGVFSDQLGHATPGMHVLNPEGHRHAPYSEEGCVIFVKLRQYQGSDRPYRRTDTNAMSWTPTRFSGIDEKLLDDPPAHSDRTALERWSAGTTAVSRAIEGGAELFVVEGRVADDAGEHGPGSWIRVPTGQAFGLRALETSVLYVKTGAVAGLRSA